MEIELMEGIPLVPDVEALRAQGGIRAGTEEDVRIQELCVGAARIARPRGMFRQAWIDEKGDDFVVVEGRRFTSRILRINLEKTHRVVAYVMTCGSELDQWAADLTDPLERWWGELLKQQALQSVYPVFEDRLKAVLGPGASSTMNPGSLPDWPLSEQGPLFDLLGDVKGTIGVELTDSFLMMPNKSVSGLRFLDNTGHVNCRLCPRKECPGRRAPYDENLLQTRFGRVPSKNG